MHISRASVSDTDSKLKSMGKEISLVGTIKSKVNLKSGYTNKFIKDLRINILVAGAQGLEQGTTMGNFLGKKQKSEKDKQNGRNSTP